MRRLGLGQWGFACLALAVGALCIRLGLWQLDRLNQRQQRNAEIQSELDRPIVDLVSEAVPPEGLAYRRLRARGVFDPAHEIVLSNRSYSGQAGVHLVTPLRLDGMDAAVLVDRGWISASQVSSEARVGLALPGTVEVVGLGRPSQDEPSIAMLADPTRGPDTPATDSWRFLNLPGIQAQVPYRLLPVIMEASEPVGGYPVPRPQTELDLSEGPHMSYAIQWFAFAAIALLGGGAWLVHSARPGPKRTQP